MAAPTPATEGTDVVLDTTGGCIYRQGIATGRNAKCMEIICEPASAARALICVVGLNTGTDEVQRVELTGSPTGGTFTLTYSGQTTAGIAFDATAAAVQSALVALSNIDTYDVVVTGPNGGPWYVWFTGTLGVTNVAAMTASGAGLTGGTTPSVDITTKTAGVAGGFSPLSVGYATVVKNVQGIKAIYAKSASGSATVSWREVEPMSNVI